MECWMPKYLHVRSFFVAASYLCLSLLCCWLPKTCCDDVGGWLWLASMFSCIVDSTFFLKLVQLCYNFWLWNWREKALECAYSVLAKGTPKQEGEGRLLLGHWVRWGPLPPKNCLCYVIL
jgi:hypothetical protein